jgi:hypothetical protein
MTLTESFRAFGSSAKIYLRDPSSGHERECAEIIATCGAVDWQQGGHPLKQFVTGAYEFVVAPTGT